MATPSRMDTRRILGNLSEGLLVGREEEEGGGEESDIEEEEEGDDDSELKNQRIVFSSVL